MRDGREIVGLVLLSAKERGRNFSAVEIGFLETVCSIASIAMKNAALYEKMFREARIDPLTGEVLPDDHVCNKGEIVRALNCAVEALSHRRKKPLPENFRLR